MSFLEDEQACMKAVYDGLDEHVQFLSKEKKIPKTMLMSCLARLYLNNFFKLSGYEDDCLFLAYEEAAMELNELILNHRNENIWR